MRESIAFSDCKDVIDGVTSLRGLGTFAQCDVEI